MGTKKIWVKRPGASATLVSIYADDVVDDVRDKIIRKYANSLGRNFDAPDVTIRIVPREHPTRQSRGVERTLGPEEPMLRMLDEYFPGGQAVEEALIIDVPTRRTPKQSPRPGQHMHYYTDESRPGEGGDYFPPMPAISSPHLPSVPGTSVNGQPGHAPVHAMSVINTGQVPTLPSPGGGRSRHHGRPRVGRTRTSSPPILTATPTTSSNGAFLLRHPPSRIADSNAVDTIHSPPVAPPLPTPPAPESTGKASTPPPVRAGSPRPRPLKKTHKTDRAPAPTGALEGAVPPINCLIVEDNIINLKLLEAFMKRLKVRWQTAMNGKDAVTKWRTGGFHLVLMDIQLPVMNGLDATKEIRRLERVNSIGVFSSSASSTALAESGDTPEGEDKLPNTHLFKSPVIIVALTASSLQSDRHEALAAGCNDFLTKPVNFVWLERKVMEWGCMQALIDFDGWRKWKDFSQSNLDGKGASATGGPGLKGSGKLARRDKPRPSTGTPSVTTDGLEGGRAIAAGA
ncbi:MAG: ssk1 response regulator receiver [Piccolia ochrophora]|nr:MAG: ssk1 response regulator receiver [Piccolia ochrophora]